jgi:CAI-1 autoinducer synthase
MPELAPPIPIAIPTPAEPRLPAGGAAELPPHLERSLQEHQRRATTRWRGLQPFRSERPAPCAIDLASNDYLRLAHHPEIVQAKIEALRRGGNDTLMSAAFLSADAVHHEFERAMAAHLRAEDAILCQSGYAANAGLLQTISVPGVPVYVDSIAHMSLWNGLALAGVTARPFSHNDVADLEAKVHEHGPGLVVVDTVYSTDGSVCPLREVVDVVRRHGCTLIADESHSLGTHGALGEGMVAALGLEEHVAFRTASLSKAFCERGGVIACPAAFVEWFRMHSHPALFSSAVMTYQAAAFLKTLELVRAAGDRRERLRRNADRLRAGLDGLGYDVDASRSQIMSLEAGSEYRTLFLRDLLAARGVGGAPFFAPATAPNRALLRLTAHAELTRAEIERVLELCAQARGAVELESWPSTRRKHGVSRRVGSVPVPSITRAGERRSCAVGGRAPLKLGVLYANVGPFAERETFLALVRAAEEAGVESLWPVEHVAVPVERHSPYPYSEDGRAPLPDRTPLGDPLLSLAFAAASSQRLRLATGILLASQRHPLYVAKQLATLDRLSGGRAILGVGIGWLREEFQALGIRFADRAARTEECVRAVRTLWADEPSAFDGRFWRWNAVESHPKPVQPGGVPIVMGGCVEASARRAARLGDGFFPVRGEPALLARLLRVLRDECGKVGRDPREIEVTTQPVSLDRDVVRTYRELGVRRLVIAPPAFDAEGLRRGLASAMEAVNAA